MKINCFIEFYRGDISRWILSMSFLYHVGSTTQTDISSSLTKFYCFNIQRGFSLPRNRCGFEFSTQYTTNHVLSLTHQSLFLHPCSCWDISVWILKQKNFVNELLTILSGPRPKPIFPAHQQNSIVSIFRGDFLSPRNRCGFEFSTQYTTNHVLSYA